MSHPGATSRGLFADRARVLVAIGVACLAGVIVAIGINTVSDDWNTFRALSLCAAGAMGTATVLLARANKLWLSSLVLTVGVGAVLCGNFVYYGLSTSNAAMGLPTTVLVAAMALGWVAGAVTLVFMLVLTVVMVVFAPEGLSDARELPTQGRTGATLVLMTAFIGGFIVAIFRGLSRAFEDLRARTKALATSERRWAQLLDATPDAVFEIDLDGKVIGANSAANQIVGDRELIGQPIGDVTALGPLAEALGDGTATGRLSGAYELILDAGPKWVEPRASTFERPDGTQGWVVVLRDIDGRVRAEQKRLAMAERDADAQRMESVGRLAGGVAHDFNNLLTVILGNADVLSLPSVDDDKRRQLATELIDAGEAATRMTRQLLAFSRRQVVAPRVVDLGEAIDKLAPMLSRLLGEHIRLDFKVASGPPCHARIDPGHLEQVVVNLTANARDAMPEGGTVTIAVERADDHCLLTVADEGSGIDEGLFGDIFEPFFTTKDPGAGTGLGLATVRSIAEQAGGSVTVSPGDSCGTRFAMKLPISATTSTTLQQSPLPDEASGVKGLRVLLVEDNEGVRRTIQRMLEFVGCHVTTAPDGEQGWGQFQARPNEWDLVMSDVVMPNLSGPELLHRIQQLHPTMRVCMMSGHTDDEVLRRRVAALDVVMLDKPFSSMQLMTALERAMSGGQDTLSGSDQHQKTAS